MNLADKPVHPFQESGRWSDEDMEEGITYKEALVLALAGNPAVVETFHSLTFEQNATNLLEQADEIIKQMEEE